MLKNFSFQLGKILLLNVVAVFGTGAIPANAVGNIIAGVEVIPGSAIGIAMLW